MQEFVATLLEWVARYGFVAIFFLMTLESACLPVPSEPVMVYGGYLVYAGHMTFVGAVAAGTLGNLLGSFIAYAIGHRTGPGVYRALRHRGVPAHKLESADRMFHRWGEPSVCIARMLPIVRTFISLPAGVARMRLRRFGVLTLVGALPFNAVLVWAGMVSGPHWERALALLHDVTYAALAATLSLLALAYLVWRFRRSRASTPDEDPLGDDAMVDAIAQEADPPAAPVDGARVPDSRAD